MPRARDSDGNSRMTVERKQALLRRFGEAVRSRRVQIGLTQEQLAALAELDRTYVGGIERGGRNPSYLNLVKLARALRVTLSQLLEGVC
jgi:transcriptional regulator with XRE-family HTH domain